MLARLDVGIVPTGDEGTVTWSYRGKVIRDDPSGPSVSGTTIGKKLSPEHQETIDRIRAYQVELFMERREQERREREQ